jgi:hypothetical protein
MLFIVPSLAFRNLYCADKSTWRDPSTASNWNRSDSKADSNESTAKTVVQTDSSFLVLALPTLKSSNWLQFPKGML